MYDTSQIIRHNIPVGIIETIWNSYCQIQHLFEPGFMYQIEIEVLINCEIWKCISQMSLIIIVFLADFDHTQSKYFISV